MKNDKFKKKKKKKNSKKCVINKVRRVLFIVREELSARETGDDERSSDEKPAAVEPARARLTRSLSMSLLYDEDGEVAQSFGEGLLLFLN